MGRSSYLAVVVASVVVIALVSWQPRGASHAQAGPWLRAYLPLAWNGIARESLPVPVPAAATATPHPTGSSPTEMPTATPTVELTATPTATEEAPPTPTTAAGSISGRLLVKGAPAVPGLGFSPGPSLYLRKCTSGGAECDQIDQTGVYDAEGHYKFESPASLSAGEFYQVTWVNEDNPPVMLGDRQYLATWYGPRIAAFESGDQVEGGDFEIANLELLAPSNGTSFGFAGAPNLQFKWEKRSAEIGGFTYRWGICSAESGCCQSVLARESAWLTESLGQRAEWQMTSYPPNVKIGTSEHPFTYPYCWFIRIQSMAAYTYGESFFIRKIWFYSSLLAMARLAGIELPDWGAGR